ncbi:uncharacterized protein YqhG [Melghiribacillus thermohalophilus]|uniref:Uncharacterized protein YqhG n=1 Tax=Melghiribacillus thermohalophilus TaxID=1324956 RepID=A0A4R3NBC5_9BACI|nr:YqhG family protein [Melghiribacillus thermohalophilus]TCT26949.1 uncharacterized protein YqhG [Melghiribacillus thermohalophilus]
MKQHDIHHFLRKYFDLNQCPVIDEQNGKITVRLTEELDRLLMNRPFYWEYMKKIGRQGEPAVITFISNPELKEEEGEWIHFGSPRLHQIFDSLLSQGKYTVVYEQTGTKGQNTPLIPWLVTNIKISYKGRQKKDEVLSIGLHLINGAILKPFMEIINPIQMDTAIADYCYTISPLIRVQSAYTRMVRFLETYLKEKDTEWAKEAFDEYQAEKQLLDHFYSVYQEKGEKEGKETRFEEELVQLKKRLMPCIQIEVVNGGMFYLSQHTTDHLLSL